MDVVVIESQAYKQIVEMFETIQKTVIELSKENLKNNRLLNIKEAAEYTGFGKAWLMRYKADIGYCQPGVKDLRFYKEDIDAFFLRHKIMKKSNSNFR